MTNTKDKITQKSHVGKSVTYKNGDLIFFNDFKNFQPRQSYYSEIYVTGMVLEGTATIRINGKSYELKPNDLFLCKPSDIMEDTTISPDFKCDCVCMAPNYSRELFPLPTNVWDIKRVLESNPIFAVRPEEAKVFSQYFDLFCTETHLVPPALDEMVDSLMHAFSLYMHSVLGRKIHFEEPFPYTTGEIHFRKFIEMLQDTYPKDRNLSYYAEKLHVTSKYLSGICKRICGQTASRLVAEYVVKDIKYMLCHSNKSIKEIAIEMNFPTLSFFGRYVKKHLGQPPKDIRREYRKRY